MKSRNLSFKNNFDKKSINFNNYVISSNKLHTSISYMYDKITNIAV